MFVCWLSAAICEGIVLICKASVFIRSVGRKFNRSSVHWPARRRKGIFITASSFRDNATEYAGGLHNKVILVDGRRLAELMIEHASASLKSMPIASKRSTAIISTKDNDDLDRRRRQLRVHFAPASSPGGFPKPPKMNHSSGDFFSGFCRNDRCRRTLSR